MINHLLIDVIVSAVSYTHLTLPTMISASVDLGGRRIIKKKKNRKKRKSETTEK